jgi:hypothetical protein
MPTSKPQPRSQRAANVYDESIGRASTRQIAVATCAAARASRCLRADSRTIATANPASCKSSSGFCVRPKAARSRSKCLKAMSAIVDAGEPDRQAQGEGGADYWLARLDPRPRTCVAAAPFTPVGVGRLLGNHRSPAARKDGLPSPESGFERSLRKRNPSPDGSRSKFRILKNHRAETRREIRGLLRDSSRIPGERPGPCVTGAKVVASV